MHPGEGYSQPFVLDLMSLQAFDGRGRILRLGVLDEAVAERVLGCGITDDLRRNNLERFM